MRLNLINQATASLANVVGVGPAGPAGANGAQGPAGSGEIVTIASTASASGALSASKHNPVDASGGVRTMTLPTGMAAGTTLTVEKEDASSNAVTITGNIRGVGSSSLSLVLRYESVTFKADASGSWWPTAGHKTKSSLDATYIGQAVGTGPGGAFTVKPIASPPLSPSGSYGIVFDKPTGQAGNSNNGIVFTIGGSYKWGMGMDVGDVEFVPVYDATGDGGGSADIMRVAPGSKWLIARQAGTPSRGNRVTISSDDGDATLGSPLTNVLYLAASTGSSATYHVKGQLDSTEVWGITKSGQMGLGSTYAGTSANAYLEVKQGAVIKSGVGQAAFLLLQTSGNATNRTWVPQVDPATGHFNIVDNTTSNKVIQVQAGALASQIIAGTNFVWLGAATSTVGFFGSTGSAKSTGWTTLTGTATKAAGSWDTSTVTLPQLAQVVKALLDLNLSRNFISA